MFCIIFICCFSFFVSRRQKKYNAVALHLSKTLFLYLHIIKPITNLESNIVFFYTFVNPKGSKPKPQGHIKQCSFYTFAKKAPNPSKGYISTSGFSYLPPKQEKSTPWVPYTFCRAGFSTDRDGNSPRLLSLICEGYYFVLNTAIGSFVLSIPLYSTLFATTTNFPL